ncbi:conserved hypothetical protein [Synechococcus sp. CC9902]|nr:conserved hypothetical protein [Synechococcus sp. CC9902]
MLQCSSFIHHFLILAFLTENLQPAIIDRVIEMAWEDRTSFEAIHYQFGLSEKEVIELMRKEMQSSSFRMWRKRVSGRKTKHAATNPSYRFRAHCHK